MYFSFLHVVVAAAQLDQAVHSGPCGSAGASGALRRMSPLPLLEHHLELP